MELLRDVYWEPDHDELKTRAWTGIYSDGGTGATSFKNCPGAVSSVDGNLLSENMGDGADDGGTCPISERCTILFESSWEWTKQCWPETAKHNCDTWRTGAILRSEALQDRACGTGRQPLPPFSSVTQKYKKITRKRYHGYEAHVCLCENTAPAASYDSDALELTSPGLAKGEPALECDPMLIWEKDVKPLPGKGLSPGEIAGIVCGSIAGFLLIVGCYIYAAYALYPPVRGRGEAKGPAPRAAVAPDPINYSNCGNAASYGKVVDAVQAPSLGHVVQEGEYGGEPYQAEGEQQRVVVAGGEPYQAEGEQQRVVVAGASSGPPPHTDAYTDACNMHLAAALIMARKAKDRNAAERVIEAFGGGEHCILEAFKVLDKDSNGYVTVAELRAIMPTNVPVAEVDAMLREADLEDHDGRLNYEEFVRFVDPDDYFNYEGVVSEEER